MESLAIYYHASVAMFTHSVTSTEDVKLTYSLCCGKLALHSKVQQTVTGYSVPLRKGSQLC